MRWCFLAWLCLLCCSWAQELRPDPRTRSGSLPNGMAYAILPRSHPHGQVAFGLLIHAGTLQEAQGQRGTAHVLSHLLLKRLASRLSGLRLEPHRNSFTGSACTAFIIALPLHDRHLLDSLLMALADAVFHATFDSAEVEKELSLILEELPRGWLEDACLCPSGGNALQDLRGSAFSAVERFSRQWYRPENATLVVVGDIPADTAEALLRRYLAVPPSRSEAPPQPVLPSVSDFCVTVAADTPSVCLSRFVPAAPLRTELDYRAWLLRQLAFGILRERLSADTRGFAVPGARIHCHYSRFSDSAELLSVQLLAPAGGKEREAAEALAYALAHASRSAISAAELEQQKARLRRSFQEAVADTDLSRLLQRVCEQLCFRQPLLSPEQQLELALRFLPAMRQEEVQQTLRELCATDWMLVLSLPADAAPPDSAELRRALQRGWQRAESEPAHHAPALLPRLPTPGRIVRQRRLPAADALEWHLANGARVILKPTRLREDQVLLWAVSPGGYSHAPEALLPSVRQIAELLHYCGAGPYDAPHLAQALTGRKVQLTPFLTETTMGFSGESTPEELETLLQLLFLFLSQPRLDTACVAAYRAAQQRILQERRSDPESLLSDTLMALYWQGHPLRRPLREDDLLQLQPQQAYGFARERFRNAARWLFFLVGAVTPAQLRPLVERYIGSLPGSPHRERPRPVRVEPVRESTTVVLHQGSESKAWMGILYGGPLQWSAENRLRLAAVTKLLHIRLENLLREKLGEDVSVRLWAQPLPEPSAWYLLQLILSCEPQQLDSLQHLLSEAIAQLQTEGPTEEEFWQVRRALEYDSFLQQQRNTFWIEVLSFHFLYGDPLPAMLTISTWLARLTPEKLRDDLGYFCARPTLRVSLLPATSGP